MKRLFWLVALLVCFVASTAYGQQIGVLIEEVDGSPSGYAYKLKVPNTSLSLADSVATISTGAGSGDVESVGDCLSGACNDGTSDGGEYMRLYDGDSHYLQIDVDNLAGNTTINLPSAFVSATADDTAAADITIDDDDAGTALTVRVDAAGAAAGTPNVGIIITTDDDDDADYDPFQVRDDSGGNDDALFTIDHTGKVTQAAVDNPTFTYDEADGTDWETRVDDVGNSFEIGSSAGGIGDNVEVEIDEDGDFHITGDVYVTGDDIFATTNTNGFVWVGDGTNYNPTQVVETEFIPVSYMEADGTTDPDALTNEDNISYRDFDDAAAEELEFFWQAPFNLSGSTLKVNVVAVITNAAAPADTEGVSWGISACSVTGDESHDCGVGAEINVEDTDLDNHASAQWDIIYLGSEAVDDPDAANGFVEVTPTGLDNGEMVKIAIQRDVADADDDYAQDIGLVGITIKYKVDIANGSW